MVRIVLCKSVRQAHFPLRVPLEFIRMKHAVYVLDVVNFLLLLRTPEITLTIKLMVRIMLDCLISRQGYNFFHYNQKLL